MPDTNSATEELGGSTTVSSIDTSPISNDVLKVADELLTQCYRDFPYDGFSRNFMDSLDSSNSSGKGNCVWFSRWFINQFHKEVEATNNGILLLSSQTLVSIIPQTTPLYFLNIMIQPIILN